MVSKIDRAQSCNPAIFDGTINSTYPKERRIKITQWQDIDDAISQQIFPTGAH
jgi:hypothetical protein